MAQVSGLMERFQDHNTRVGTESVDVLDGVDGVDAEGAPLSAQDLASVAECLLHKRKLGRFVRVLSSRSTHHSGVVGSGHCWYT